MLLLLVFMLSDCGGEGFTDIYQNELSENEVHSTPDNSINLYSDESESNNFVSITDSRLESWLLDKDILPFATVVERYRRIEKNGFIDSDREYTEQMGQLHPIVWRYNMGMLTSYWRVLYAFYDVTGDGQPELLIGATGRRNFHPYIVGIYMILDDCPVSVIQYAGGRTSLHLSVDLNENIIILSTWGHMGNAHEAFYSVNENGSLILLDKIWTYDFDRIHYNETGELERERFRHIDGVIEYICEKEYVEIVEFYGSFGYEPIREIITRPLIISWHYILP